MACLSGSIYSRVLKMRTGLTVTTPADHVPDGTISEYPCVYLLHGLSDDHSCWLRYTSCERYAKQYRLNLIMPEVQRSFYCDMDYGPAYFSYITEELPQLAERLFGLRPDRENTFVMGLSMGGYGALKCAFRKPALYAGAAAFSTVADLDRRPEFYDPEYYAICRHNLREEDDLHKLAVSCTATKPVELPRLFLTCGKQDFLYEGNQELLQTFQKQGVPYTYEEWDGVHDWDFWDASLTKALAFFFSDRTE